MIFSIALVPRALLANMTTPFNFQLGNTDTVQCVYDALYYNVLHCTVPYFVILYCTVLCCTVLYCTAL